MSHRSPLWPPSPSPRRTKELDAAVLFLGYLAFPEDGGAGTPRGQALRPGTHRALPTMGMGLVANWKEGDKKPQPCSAGLVCHEDDMGVRLLCRPPPPRTKHPSPRVDRGVTDPHPLYCKTQVCAQPDRAGPKSCSKLVLLGCWGGPGRGKSRCSPLGEWLHVKDSILQAPAGRSARGLALGCSLPTPIWGGTQHPPRRSWDTSLGRALADTGLRGCSLGRTGTGEIWGFPVGRSPPAPRHPRSLFGGDTEGEDTVASAEQPQGQPTAEVYSSVGRAGHPPPNPAAPPGRAEIPPSRHPTSPGGTAGSLRARGWGQPLCWGGPATSWPAWGLRGVGG